MLPAMETEVLDEMLGGASGVAGKRVPSAVGNSYLMQLTKHGIKEVGQNSCGANCRRECCGPMNLGKYLVDI